MGERYYKRKDWLTGETYYTKDSDSAGGIIGGIIGAIFYFVAHAIFFVARAIFPYILPLILILIAGAIPFILFLLWNDIMTEEIWDTEEILFYGGLGFVFLGGILTFYLLAIPDLYDSAVKQVYKFSYSTCIIPLICGIIICCITSEWNWGFYNFILFGSICIFFFSLIYEIIFKKLNEKQKKKYYATSRIIVCIIIFIGVTMLIIGAIKI